MNLRVLFFALAMASVPALGDSAYQLDIGTSRQGSSLKVEPTVTGPADKSLRYEMDVRREGRGGSSNSNQAGTVRLDSSGHGKLASNSVSVSSADRYRVTVKLYDADRLVAEQSAQYP